VNASEIQPLKDAHNGQNIPTIEWSQRQESQRKAMTNSEKTRAFPPPTEQTQFETGLSIKSHTSQSTTPEEIEQMQEV
jgi:hypothetical protein